MPSERSSEGQWHREDSPKSRPGGAVPKIPTRGNLRKHVRFEVDEATPLMYVKGLLTWAGIGRQNLAQHVLNLSEGGILLKASEKIPLGTKVHLRLRMEKYNDEFHCDGVVRRCYPGGRRDGEFHVGVQFSDLAEEQAKKLAKMRDWFTSPEYKAKSGARNKGTIQFGP